MTILSSKAFVVKTIDIRKKATEIYVTEDPRGKNIPPWKNTALKMYEHGGQPANRADRGMNTRILATG